MGLMIVGTKKYIVPDLPEALTYRIGKSAFRGVGKRIRDDLVNELADMLVIGYDLLMNGKDIVIPPTFDIDGIKNDIMNPDIKHDHEVQKLYLRETRKYWEQRYSFRELTWLVDFGDMVLELGGDVGEEWYRMYEIIKGEMPEDFPAVVSFSLMIDNVCERRIEKYVRRVVKDYFEEHPEAIGIINQQKIPEDLPVDAVIGLEPTDFIRYAHEKIEERTKRDAESETEAQS